MRKHLLTTLAVTLGLAFSAPAFAVDSGDAAFELLSQYTAQKSKENYIKLQSSIAASDAMDIDAKLSEIYGTPEISRGGLKVWEVPNESGSRAEHTTIMCGPNGKGGLLISVDRRGPIANGANTKMKAKRKAQRKAELKSERKAQRSAAKNSSPLLSQERD